MKLKLRIVQHKYHRIIKLEGILEVYSNLRLLVHNVALDKSLELVSLLYQCLVVTVLIISPLKLWVGLISEDTAFLHPRNSCDF